MNDPGLDGPIADVEKSNEPVDDITREEQEEEELLLAPSRWWFASTASPLIAGTVGPMASAFNIIAIAQYWREHIAPGAGEDNSPSIPDPHWLLAVNGVSLAFAVIANVALCLNMVGRLRFAWAQPISIIGFFIASILLIILVCIAGKSDFRPDPPTDYALTQAFYYACWAAGLYLIIDMLMIVTVYGALTGKYKKQFELNGSQRTLMLQTTAFMVYLIGGAAVYTRLENWTYPDAVFWADVTLLTIGFGTPLVPVTHAGRSLLIPYVFGGLIAVGLVIGSIRAMLLEAGSVKMHARTTEKKRQKVITLKDAEPGKSSQRLFHSNRPSKRADTHYKTERERRRHEFLAMRKIQRNAEDQRKWVALSVSSTVAAGLWAVGAVIFWKAEYAQDWTYFESLYFAFVSLTTLGYGDLEPYSNSGKSFFVLWSLLAIPTLTVLVSDLGGTIVKLAADLTALIGSLTVAPTSKEFWRRLKRNIDIVFGQNKHPIKEKGKLTLNKDQIAVIRKKDQYDDSRLGKWPDLLYARLSKKERDAIDDYGHNCEEEQQERDTLFYHFLLVKEIRAVLRDMQLHQDKTYTYDEWAYFLKLVGHDEENDELHTKRYNKPKKDDEDGTQVGRIFGHDGEAREWSWLSLRSPLLSQKSEPEWVLDRLLRKLQGEMQFDRRTGKAPPDEYRPRFDMMRFTRRPSRAQDESQDGLSSTATQQVDEEEEPIHGRGRDKGANRDDEERDDEEQQDEVDEARDDRRKQKHDELNEAEEEAARTP